MKTNTFWKSILIILAFLLAVYGNRLVQQLVPISFDSTLQNLLYSYAWWILPIVITIGYLYGFKNIVQELCLNRNIVFAFIFGLVTVSPMLISSFIMGEMDKDIDWTLLLRKTVIAGFMEEILFRGFLFGILFRKLGWGFITASLPGAIIFGLGHLYQGSSLSELTGIFLITFIGSAWFAWLFIEWNENLWVPIFLHILMNLSWALFNMSDNAMGDTYTNIFRFVTITFTVITTILYCLKRGYFRINRNNLMVNKEIF